VVTKQCRQGLGFVPKDAVFANWNRYNDKCKSINMTTAVDAIYGHEGMGAHGGQGHESLARGVASDGSHDPYAAIEKLVFPDSASLESVVHSIVVPIAVEITDRSDDSTSTAPGYPAPNGNYPGGPMWFWSSSTNDYFLGQIQAF
jgi:hypothetical protein